jgi:D-inositol-3-phosphate glycosyltransferase
MLDKLNLRQQVSFAGRIDHSHLPRYYSAADVLAVPSRYESFGLVVLEALACGTPVVATPVGAMENIIRQGVTGVVVPDFSPRLFAKALKAMLAGTHKTLPEAARSSIAGYTWARTASHLMEHMHTVITHYRREHRTVQGREAELLTKGSCL